MDTHSDPNLGHNLKLRRNIQHSISDNFPIVCTLTRTQSGMI